MGKKHSRGGLRDTKRKSEKEENRRKGAERNWHVDSLTLNYIYNQILTYKQILLYYEFDLHVWNYIKIKIYTNSKDIQKYAGNIYIFF